MDAVATLNKMSRLKSEERVPQVSCNDAISTWQFLYSMSRPSGRPVTFTAWPLKYTGCGAAPTRLQSWFVSIQINACVCIPAGASTPPWLDFHALRQYMHRFSFGQKWSTSQQASTMHHVQDRKSGAMRKWNICKIVKIKSSVFRPGVFNYAKEFPLKLTGPSCGESSCKNFRQGQRKTHHR